MLDDILRFGEIVYGEKEPKKTISHECDGYKCPLKSECEKYERMHWRA
jgi:hypothetical protein